MRSDLLSQAISPTAATASHNPSYETGHALSQIYSPTQFKSKTVTVPSLTPPEGCRSTRLPSLNGAECGQQGSPPMLAAYAANAARTGRQDSGPADDTPRTLSPRARPRPAARGRDTGGLRDERPGLLPSSRRARAPR